jgi:hypothetical protein
MSRSGGPAGSQARRIDISEAASPSYWLPHTGSSSSAREEAMQDRTPEGARQSFIRRCVLEALRLWPTTPAILRENDGGFSWNDCQLRKGTGIIIFTPFFGRDDDERLEFANKMSPSIWERSQNDALASSRSAAVPPSARPTIWCHCSLASP